MRQTDKELENTIYSVLRRCPHDLEDSVVAKRLATAIILMEQAVEAQGRAGL